MEQTGRHSTVDGDATAPLRRRDTTVTALRPPRASRATAA
jgi:hypothetical protein